MTTTAKLVTEFSSIALQTKLCAARRGVRAVRAAWRLSDGREVLLTARRCHVAEVTGGKVWSIAYPPMANAWIAVQRVMAVEAGCDPFAGGEEKR